MRVQIPRWSGIAGVVLVTAALTGLAGGTAAVAQPVSATTWTVQAGAGTAGDAVASLQYYSNNITIDAGDSVTWRAVGNAHTVSFLSGAAAPTPDDPAATAPAGGATYDGTGFVSSGLFFPVPDGVPGPPNRYTLTFTAPGSFTYQCLIHPGMQGQVTVQAAGAAYPSTQAQYDAPTAAQSAADLAPVVDMVNGFQTTTSTSAGGHTTYSISGGMGNGGATSLRFTPNDLAVAAGDTVMWTNTDPVEPHTVTFAGPDGKLPTFPSQAAVTPTTSSTYDGAALANSGLLAGPPGAPSTQFSLTFTTPGAYQYVCLIHFAEGMAGTIVVHP